MNVRENFEKSKHTSRSKTLKKKNVPFQLATIIGVRNTGKTLVLQRHFRQEGMSNWTFEIRKGADLVKFGDEILLANGLVNPSVR